MDEPAIALKGVTKLFGRGADALARRMADPSRRAELIDRHRSELALVDVDLSVERGTIQVVMGLSGSGKSTLVRHINRLVEPTCGSVVVEGEDVLALSETALLKFRRDNISMVFQRFGLLPHRTVLENVAYGLKMADVPPDERRRRALAWIERVGLSGNEARYPTELSGGMQQRVGLARALATDAPILLMDEAFSALDPLIRTDMQSLLLDLHKEIGRTVVFITHDLDEALRLGDRIAILKDGELVREGTGQEILLDPGSDYVAAFVGDVDHGRWVEIGSLPPLAQAEAVLPQDEGPGLPARTRLRDAARQLASSGRRSALILSDEGAPLRRIGLDEIVIALSRPSRLDHATAARNAPRIADGA